VWISVSNDAGDVLARFEIPSKRVREDDGSETSKPDMRELFRSLTQIVDIALGIAFPDDRRP
jgi:hypothetical protein